MLCAINNVPVQRCTYTLLHPFQRQIAQVKDSEDTVSRPLYLAHVKRHKLSGDECV